MESKNKKNLRNHLAERLVLRGERKIYLQEVRKLEWASAEEIEAYQKAHLKRVLTDAKENIPYYRDRASGLELKDFPVLTRNEIKIHREDLIVPSRIKNTTMQDTTSGTTSIPVSFLLDLEHRDRGAMQKVFFNEWAGLHLGDRMVKLWGHFPAKTRKGRLRNALSDWTRNMVWLDCLDMRSENMVRYAQEIQVMQPKLILGYANSMTEFANYLDRNSIDMEYHGTIMSSTSSLTAEKRAAIEKVFDCPIFDRYGSREMIDFACDCERHEGLHVSPYMHVVEILDEEGNPCPPGMMGRVVVTQLFNPVMPLIRYDLGDYATWAEESCSCGRNWPMLKTVDGRAISVFKRRDGGRFSSYYCIYHVNRTIGQNRIRRQQIIQEDYNRFTIRLVMEEPENWPDQKDNRIRLEQKIGEAIGESVHVVFDLVDEIPNQPSGKFLQAICRVED